MWVVVSTCKKNYKTERFLVVSFPFWKRLLLSLLLHLFSCFACLIISIVHLHWNIKNCHQNRVAKDNNEVIFLLDNRIEIRFCRIPKVSWYYEISVEKAYAGIFIGCFWFGGVTQYGLWFYSFSSRTIWPI